MTLLAEFESDMLTISAGTFSLVLTAKQIESTWNALSHFPDRRARLELQELTNRLNYFAGRLDTITAQGGDLDVAAEAETFARRHVELTRRAWAVESRCMSWFIVGPANFPVSRNEKRMNARDKAYAAVSAHTANAVKAVERTAWPHGAPSDAIRMSNPDAPSLIRAKIEKRRHAHAMMKAANEAIRAAKTDDEAALIEAVRGATGFAAATCAKIIEKDYAGRRGFATYALSGELAEIKRLEGRLAAIEANLSRGMVETSHNTTIGSLEIVENPEAGRIQLRFPGKPDAATRDLLKSNGFRWAPSEGAWQRHLNNAGRYAAQRVLSGLQAEAA